MPNKNPPEQDPRPEKVARTRVPRSKRSADSDATQMRVTPAPLERPRDEEFRPVLICLSGELRGQRKALVSREMVIGRSSSADWHIDDGITSRTHALIVYDNHDDPGAMPRCYVEDLGSRNGTELNGKPIEGKTRLVERDRLLVGSTVIGFFVRDSEELQNEMSLYHSATRDPLTGLENRRQMVANLKGMMAKTSLGQRTLAFLLLDLDLFKQVNDTHGHDVGDEALKHVASIIRQTVREVDKTARWGGEEFAVIMPNVTASTAVRVAENLRRTIQAQPLMTSQGSVELTISIGVTLLVDNDSIESFFQRADQLLYKAKELGRNRVEADGASSTPSPIPPESEAARGPEGSASSG